MKKRTFDVTLFVFIISSVNFANNQIEKTKKENTANRYSSEPK